MHQTMIALFVLLWLITDIHVATGNAGICMACALFRTWQETENAYQINPCFFI